MSAGKIDPMEQFMVEPVLGRHMNLFGYDVSFTNSALFMVVVFVLLALFMSGGLKRQLIPGRWQVMAEGAVSFIDNMVTTSIGSGGKKFAPYIFSLFFFILFANSERVRNFRAYCFLASQEVFSLRYSRNRR